VIKILSVFAGWLTTYATQLHCIIIGEFTRLQRGQSQPSAIGGATLMVVLENQSIVVLDSPIIAACFPIEKDYYTLAID
jgi:hypothetical protein